MLDRGEWTGRIPCKWERNWTLETGRMMDSGYQKETRLEKPGGFLSLADKREAGHWSRGEAWKRNKCSAMVNELNHSEEWTDGGSENRRLLYLRDRAEFRSWKQDICDSTNGTCSGLWRRKSSWT